MIVTAEHEDLCLVERYGLHYIRFRLEDGNNYEIPVKAKEAEKIIKHPKLLHRILKHYQKYFTFAPNEMMDLDICEYLMNSLDYSQVRANSTVSQLSGYREIRDEFFKLILDNPNRKKPVESEGYTAEKLMYDYPLNLIGAYTYLVKLRRNPQDALEELKKM